jgi:hypothetical protein
MAGPRWNLTRSPNYQQEQKQKGTSKEQRAWEISNVGGCKQLSHRELTISEAPTINLSHTIERNCHWPRYFPLLPYLAGLPVIKYGQRFIRLSKRGDESLRELRCRSESRPK